MCVQSVEEQEEFKLKTMNNKLVSFDEQTLELFKSSYNQAIALKQESFLFNGDEYIVGYAKYLIEYLNLQFKIQEPEKKFKRKQ